MTTMTRLVRPPAVAGMFYSGTARTLRRDIEALVDEAVSELPSVSGRMIGAIVPHAGYQYSGRTAASVYALLGKADVETAVFVGPSHREAFHGSAVFPGTAFATPLGEVAIDVPLATALAAAGGSVASSAAGHRLEHAIEVQVPFLQVLCPQAKMVAVTMGDQGSRSCGDLAKALASVLKNRSAVVIASSDLSHYHPYAEAVLLDRVVAGHVRSFQSKRLQEDLQHDRVEACGGGPMVAVMTAAQSLGATTATVLHACNSGDVTGDHLGVVGYLSAVFTTS
ncbi:MAG: AmmeMemoRadiSam system protein B [Bacteroidetes bacterium]|jgi:hypothetical protein|nr:AmmeMemoRadiSam system protein B [Bacteroidota bacterium]